MESSASFVASTGGGGGDCFENTKWFLENLVAEYRAGFESLKCMLPFCRSKLAGNQRLDQLEYELACVEANLMQLDGQYKNLNAAYQQSYQHHSDVSQHLDSGNCVPVAVPSIETAPYDHQAPVANSTVQCFNSLELPSLVECQEGTSTTTAVAASTSIDYLFSGDSSDDFFEFIKADDSTAHLYHQSTASQRSNSSDQENQDEQACMMLVGIHQATLETDTANKPEKTTRSRAKNSKSTAASLRKPRPNECRIWYKCAWDGCSFGSYYNGVVKRHSHKRHSGNIKIDKSSNSSMHRFKCDWPGCEVSLVAYHKLVEHKRKHTGEKPFRCKWKSCNYATARLYSMIIHERTHKLDPFGEAE